MPRGSAHRLDHVLRSIVILTGAGISAESGVATFRDKDGIWSKVDYRDVATPRGFARDPAKVHDFYNMRRRTMAGRRAQCRALSRWRGWNGSSAGDFLLVTQNIDDLHERAGSEKLIHMHGELARALCGACGDRRPWRDDLSVDLACASCGERAA